MAVRLRLTRKTAPGGAPGSVAPLARLPPDVHRHILQAGYVRELLCLALCCRGLATAVRVWLSGRRVCASVSAQGAAGDDAFVRLEGRAFREQPASGAWRASFSLPSPAGITPGLAGQLAAALPFGSALKVDICEVRDVSELQECAPELQALPLRSVHLKELDEGDVTALCKLLQALGTRLEKLDIVNFCASDPSVENLVPILRALPATCTALGIQHVLPLTLAAQQLPATVREFGTLVLMKEVFYHSRVVGMSFTRFRSAFPTLPQLQALDVILGPGHYEEPTWEALPGWVLVDDVASAGRAVSAAVQEKFPSLQRLRLEAVVQSAYEPPLVEFVRSLTQAGVAVEIKSLRPCNASAMAVDAARRLTAELLDQAVQT